MLTADSTKLLYLVEPISVSGIKHMYFFLNSVGPGGCLGGVGVCWFGGGV